MMSRQTSPRRSLGTDCSRFLLLTPLTARGQHQLNVLLQESGTNPLDQNETLHTSSDPRAAVNRRTIAPGEPVSTATEAPKGFAPMAPEVKTGPKVKKEDLAKGVIVKHVGTRRIDRRDGTVSTVHTFLNRAGAGKRFSLWGTSQLDSILRQAKPGVIVYLRYVGKIDTPNGQAEHQWQVNAATGAVPVSTLDEFTARHDVLDNAIDEADAAYQSRAQADGMHRDEDAPPPDDEVPF